MADIREVPNNARFPLALYEQILIGELTSRDDEIFDIYAGLNEGIVRQLREKSLDESDTEIQTNTSDRERFGTGSYEDWYAKDRVPFVLIHRESAALAALIWFGPKQLGRKSLKHLTVEEQQQDEKELDNDNWHTIVYRAYNPFRGKGIMKDATKFVIDSYRRAFPVAKLWAGIHAENPASLGLATALGLVTDDERSNPAEHHYVMVESV